MEIRRYNLKNEFQSSNFEEKKTLFLGLVEHSRRGSFIFGSEFTAQVSTFGVSFVFGTLQALGSHQPSVLEKDGAFFFSQ